ncbi:MAG: hypothetical protein Q9196_007080 [Gyalolechia fulgens]
MQAVKPMGTEGRLVDAEQEISRLKKENDWLDQEREDLIADLKRCQSELSALRPATQITDESLRRDLLRIRQEIDDFVYSAMVDVEDDALYTFCMKQSQTPKKQKEPTELGRFVRKADITAWGPYPYSNFCILSIILEWTLNEYVFKERYPLVIKKARKEVLGEIEDGMRHSRQAEDIARWRSESLIALTRPPKDKYELTRISKRIRRHLSSTVSQWLRGAHASTTIGASFQRRILNPSIKFHQDFRSSYHRYTIESIKDVSGRSPKEMLKEWHLKAADTWGPVKTEDQVGTALYCLHPALVRRRPGGADPVTIVKPVVVITRLGRERILDNPIKQETVLRNATEQLASRSPSSSYHTIHSPDEDSLAGTAPTNISCTDTYSDSDMTSGNESYDQDERRHPIGHIEEEHEQISEAQYSDSVDVKASEERHQYSETSRLGTYPRSHQVMGPGGVIQSYQEGPPPLKFEVLGDDPLGPRKASTGGGKDAAREVVSHRGIPASKRRQSASGLLSNPRGVSNDSPEEKPIQQNSTSDNSHASTSRRNSVPTLTQSVRNSIKKRFS